MKKKHFIAPALALGIIGGAIAVPNAIFADSNAVTDSTPATTGSTAVSQSANTSTDVNTPKAGDHVITPQDTNKVLNKSLANTDMSERFYIDPHYGYARVYVHNDGKAPINITVTQGSASGPVKMKGRIAKGETFDEINSSAWTVGSFYVNLTSPGGPMEGGMSVRIGNTREELQ
ncbi:hypothetical protein MF625_004058 [Paenibacillus polymyxa]|uniref:hypothetical protein n=1 Tax=Paenibacillus polymyxa TaxID=1406 RepID=UPI002025B5BF|nr:hypothetical protein [Paenibacillus polymyxa]URJ34753.1 hypothetical protein MF625_004058 [Paenibacillus polymyxa]